MVVVLSESEDEPEKKGRVSPAVSLDSMGERVTSLLKSPDTMGGVSEGQNTLSLAGTQHLPNYLFDDPGKSMSLPIDSTSNVSEETPIHTQTSMTLAMQDTTREHRQYAESKKIDVVADSDSNQFNKNLFTSDDLQNRVQQLLVETDHLSDGKAMSIQTESDRQSIASSLDYKALAQDLDDIQSNLESLKSDSDVEQSSRRSSQISQPSVTHPTNSAFTSEYSTPKKYNWDHGADVGIASEEDEQYKRSEMPLEKQKLPTIGDMGPNPLLTSGVVPFDVALDIMHGSGASPQRRSYQSTVPPNKQEDIFATGQEEVDESDNEVAALNSSDHRDTSQQISDIMERESPCQHQYKYLQDSEDNESVNIGMGPRVSNFETEDRAVVTSPANLTTGSYSFNMSPLKPHQPFNAFGRIGSMFSTQADKVSQSQFDRSIELRSPVKRRMESNVNCRSDQHLPKVSPTSYETGDLDQYRTLWCPAKLAKSHEELGSRYRDPDSSSMAQPKTGGRSYEQDLLGQISEDRAHSFNQSVDRSFEQRANLSRSHENLSTSAHREMVYNTSHDDRYQNNILERLGSPHRQLPVSYIR